MISLILGVGEIGGAYYEILSPYYPTYKLDIRPGLSSPGIPANVEIMHVCLRYGPDWYDSVAGAVKKYKPNLINVQTTTPPGTTAELGMQAVHSTTRGMHPALRDYIMATPKHIGGPHAEDVAQYFRKAGIECVTHSEAKTTEAAHILSNCLYGASILFAREMDALCRAWGVDYYESVMRYSETHNQGYRRMGIVSKMRPIVHPPGAAIGGHCVTQNARLVPEHLRGPIMSALAEDGE